MNIITLRFLLLVGVLGRSSLGQEVVLSADEEPVTSFDCPSPCVDTQFCGRDLQCHAYSCEAWYELGPQFFSGYVPGSSEDLACTGNLEEDRTFFRQAPLCDDHELPLAAEYVAPNASSTPCFDPDREEQLSTYSFTRKCTARPTSDTSFICYDIGPNTDFDALTQEYVEQTQALDSNGARHSYKLYVEGYTLREENGNVYPSSIGEIRSLGEGGDQSVFNATAARAAMRASKIRTFDSPLPLELCTEGCLVNEFCGTDGKCHAINCDDFWEHGAVEFTGNDGSTEMNCTLQLQESTVNPCPGEWPFAVEYRCNEANILSSQSHVCPRSEARHLPFRRMCTAQPNPSQEFVCFDLKGVGSIEEYAADYIQSTTDNPECTDAERHSFSWISNGTTDSETVEWVAYHHQTHRTSNDGYSTSLYFKAPYTRVEEGESLDLDSLEHAMFTRLVGAAPGGPLEDDGESASSSSVMKTGGITITLLAAIAFVLIL